MDEFNGEYGVLSVSQKQMVEKKLLDSVFKSLYALHNAERAYKQHLAVQAGSLPFNQPSADESISVASTQVNVSTNQSNDTNEDRDDDAMSAQSVINLEDEFNSDDSDGQPDAEEEPNETQTETEINQSSDTATRDEQDQDDEPTITVVNFEEFEAQLNDNPNIQDTATEGASNDESANISLPDVSLDTFDSNQTHNEQQSEAMKIYDLEIIDQFQNKQSQDGPSIIFVNYEEFDTSSIGSPNNQDTVAESSANEEPMNIVEPDGEFEGNVETANLNEDDSEQQFEAVMNEANSEQDQAGLHIVMNPVSTTTRRSTRASASKTVNYVGAFEDSFADQQVTLTGTRKRKRSIRRSGKSTALKRTRKVPSNEVAAEIQHQVNDDSKEDENEESKSEDISLSIIIRRLKCRVPGCKKMFPSKVQLDDHHLAKHAIEKCACKVKDCIESYATWDELKVHRNSVHGHLGTNWPCGQCETTCSSYQKLYKHVYYYHEEGQFSCSADKCNYTERTRIKVKTHQQTHRPAKYRCTFAGCTSSFYSNSSLAIHLRSHTKEKPFFCSQCPKAFSQKGNLASHELTHSGLKPYSCTWPHCDYSAKQQPHVITHVRMIHFHLPQTKKEQTEKNIIDDRDPRVFVAKNASSANELIYNSTSLSLSLSLSIIKKSGFAQ